MRIIVVSDTHGNRDKLEQLILTEKFDYFFFLGDGLNDLGDYECLENVIAVSGNCDFFSVIPNEKILKIGKYSVFATHGNKYFVKNGLNKIRECAEKVCADFVFYGHTHKCSIEKINNIYYINPGSFYPNCYGECWFVEIIINNDEIKINKIHI